ncbi:MAG: protein phosphatase 2C domain-containing protein [Fimbriimonadales bacterium]|nr:protein phosphatase 2C domain-containing protein [Fimbriimonadales bacterium]
MNEEITAELSLEQLQPAPAEPLRVLPIVKFVARSEIGKVRENNEDKFDFYEPDEPERLSVRGSVYLVCDGMGGHEAGQIASELASKLFLHHYYHSDGTPQDAAERAVLQAHTYIQRMGQSIPSRRDMGTTLTALILRQDEGILVHVGDSRCYRMRNGELQQLTRDHTLVQEWVAQGLLPPDAARYHPYSSVITQAIGVEGERGPLKPDIETFPLQEGDLFLLCSDGLTDMLEDAEIAEILRQQPPTQAAWTLIDRALAEGGRDNVTVVLVQIRELRQIMDAESAVV